ncbi:MAG: MtrB/PioB family outer membrane beta-barrel protein, partial [Acidobacteria bacterium]|nr:MtrB/PioB family outer membrane beta-barrel protein [Acidobacteriota bacterium]
MRILKSMLILAIAMAPAAAVAQTKSADAPAATTALFDLGVRGTSTTGQPARYERFRDLGDGLFLETFRFTTDKSGWLVNLGADHVGRADQKYFGAFVRPGQFKANASWDQIPFLMSQTVRTPYEEVTPGVFRLADSQQLVWQNMSTTLRYPSFQAAIAASPTFELKSRRHTAAGGFEYLMGQNATFKVNAKQSFREGNQPFGTYLSTEIELPVPIDNKLTDVDASLEAAKGNALFRLGYTGSWFSNNTGPIIWDNPARAADKTDTANTSSQGRLPALAPDSTRIGVNAMVSYKLPKRSRLTAYGMVASLKDGGESILPFTINSGVATPPALFRSTVEGEARTTAAHLTFTSRPNKLFNFIAKYRYFNFDNRTPVFTVTSRVGNDGGTVNSTSRYDTEPFALKRNTLDADLYVTPKMRGGLSVGYTRSDETRNDRIFSTVVENTGRVKFDLTGGGPINIRSVYEHSQRRGEDLDEALLISVSEKRTMRHYDIADRDRDRFTVLGSFAVLTNWSLNASTAIGRDNYLNSALGLQDNNHNVYSVGFTGTPTDMVNLGLSYSYEDYHTKQMNNTGSSTTVIDLARNFSTNGDDKVHSLIGNLDVMGIGDKVDLHFMYDFNQTRANYTFGTGDPITTTLATPVSLPEIKSDLTRATA